MSPRSAPVSRITGRRQMKALRIITIVAITLAAVSLILPSPYEGPLALIALVMVVTTPVLRVGWLIFRWSQERDARFVVAGTVLLSLVAFGAIASALGLGR